MKYHGLTSRINYGILITGRIIMPETKEQENRSKSVARCQIAAQDDKVRDSGDYNPEFSVILQVVTDKLNPELKHNYDEVSSELVDMYFSADAFSRDTKNTDLCREGSKERVAGIISSYFSSNQHNREGVNSLAEDIVYYLNKLKAKLQLKFDE